MNLEVEKFVNWLTKRGVEILPCTNEYELLRFKGNEVGMLYKTGKVSGKYVTDAIKAFQANSYWDGKPDKEPRIGGNKRKTVKEELLKRDGDCCFYCGHRFNYYMGKISMPDVTLEHLIPVSSGGTNLISNLVLCHKQCNEGVGNLPLAEKVKIAINNRIKL
jgi:HNH endonuclease